MTRRYFRNNRTRHYFTALLAVAGLSALSACSVTWVDAAGVTHIAGFNDIQVPPPDPTKVAGRVVIVATVGVSVMTDENRTDLALGYNRVSVAAFLDNAIACGPFDRIQTFDKPNDLRGCPK